MTHIHSKLETLHPLPPEIRELIFHHILSTRYKPLKCALSETCRKYYDEPLSSLYHTVSLNPTMADLFLQGLDSELSAEESSRPYLNRARNVSPHHLGPGQSPAGRRLRLLSSAKAVTPEDIGAVQGCLAAINTISKLNFPKVPLDSWTEKHPGYSYNRFGHFRPLFCFSSRWPIGWFSVEQASDEPAEQRKLFIIQATHDLVWEPQA